MEHLKLNIQGRLWDIYTLPTRFFEVDGKEYEIVGTHIAGMKPDDCIHTIKDATGRWEVHHKKLIDLFKQQKLKTVWKLNSWKASTFTSRAPKRRSSSSSTSQSSATA